MKVSSTINTHIQTLKPQARLERKAPSLIATGIGIDIRHKGAAESVVKENDPNDPLVAKKVLDALSLDLINFSQKERNTLASILGGRAEAVVESRS